MLENITSAIDWSLVVDNEHPSILLRDYVRGIFEYMYSFGGIIINIENYRPPYKSKWPLENYLPSVIEGIDDKHSKIKYSVQGFLNDFGKYTMKHAELWTNTELSCSKPKSWKDFHYEFALSLPEGIKEEYLKLIYKKVEEKTNKNFNFLKFLENLEDEPVELCDHEKIGHEDLVESVQTDSIPNKPIDYVHNEEELYNKINGVLSEEKQEYFRSLRSQGISDQTGKFDYNLGCRWVIYRAYELGWNKELFDEFESLYCNNYYGRINGVVERIGKKYQWIAYHELLARLSDNLIFADRGYEDVDDSQFYGPWQIDVREMDPTYWLKAKAKYYYDDRKSRWWRPYSFNLSLETLGEQIDWLWDTKTLPDFNSIICPKEPKFNSEWIVLFEFCDWKNKSIIGKVDIGEPNLWYRINSCIIKNDNLELMKDKFKGQALCSPDIINIPNSQNQTYLGEYPWHPCYNYLTDWNKPDRWRSYEFPCEYHIPIFEYQWSTGSYSHMPDESSNFYMPSKKIINELGLFSDETIPSKWYHQEDIVFFDPSLDNNTQPCALINKNTLCEWLQKNNLTLIWLIGGEKQLFNYNVEKFYGRLVYGSLFYMNGSGVIEGESWSEKELPSERE